MCSFAAMSFIRVRKTCCASIQDYVHAEPDKFKNATFFYPDRPSVHTKTAFLLVAGASNFVIIYISAIKFKFKFKFSVTENGTF